MIEKVISFLTHYFLKMIMDYDKIIAKDGVNNE